MKVEIEVPDYDARQGVHLEWEDGFTIDAQLQDRALHITANTAGLISLARLLLTLAQSNVPSGCDVHLDESNALEDNACELIIEKV